MLRNCIYWFYNKFFKRFFPLWQKFGLNITLNHYYSPIPDLREIPESIWSKQTELIGINLNEKSQLNLLSIFKKKYKEEYDLFPMKKKKILKPYEYYLNNKSFGPVSGEILYSMIRHFKPKKIIEIGSGFSTLCSAQAIRKNKEDNEKFNCDLISIEPFPNKILKNGFPGFSKLIPKKVQEISFLEFQKLDENDILFIDSSHILKINSDVQYEYLEILPRLKKGVIIHIHDILLPTEYFQKWIFRDFLFFNEQYLLQAFLSFNNSFEIMLAGSYLHFKHPDKLETTFKSYNTSRFSTSFWIKKID